MGLDSFKIPGETYHGDDFIHEIPPVLKKYGNRVFIVTDPLYRNTSRLRSFLFRLQENGIDNILYDNLPGHITFDVLTEAVRLAKAGKIDMLLAYGGTTITMAAKTIALAIKTGTVKGILGTEPISGETLPVFAVATSIRNYNAYLPSAYILNKKSMRPVFYSLNSVSMKGVFFDASLSESISNKNHGTICLDMILSAFEGLKNPNNSFISKSILFKVIEYAFSALEALSANKPGEGNDNCWKAGVLMSMTMNSVKRGIGSALVEAFRAGLQIPRSWSASVLLPHILDANMGIDPDLYRRIVYEIDESLFHLTTSESVLHLSALVRRKMAQIELPARLNVLEVTKKEIREIAELAISLSSQEQLFETDISLQETVTLLEQAL